MVEGFPMRTDLPDSIEMICKKCGKTHDMPYDTYLELLEMYDPFEESEFLIIECVYCHKCDMLPTKYLKTKITTRKV